MRCLHPFWQDPTAATISADKTLGEVGFGTCVDAKMEAQCVILFLCRTLGPGVFSVRIAFFIGQIGMEWLSDDGQLKQPDNLGESFVWGPFELI